jgi:phosphatidate cytidylyltransferase
MARRILTAAVLLTIVACGFYYDELAWLLILSTVLIAVLCVGELMEMLRHKGLRVYRRVAIFGVVGLMLEAALTHMENSILVFGLSVCFALVVRMRGRVGGAWGDITGTCFAIAYVGIPMAAILKIFLSGPFGEAWLLLALTIIWTTDSFALFVGKRFGKIKLWPKISPGKTWEGAIGGVAGALCVVVVVREVFPSYFPGLSDLEMIFFAILFSVIGQFGDLAESLIKRDVGVKDSGGEWTGHGGFVDMMDGVLFTAIPLLIYLEITRPEILKAALPPL